MAGTITTATGSFSHGESVTISGSGFGVKTQAAPQKWEDFESYEAGEIPAMAENHPNQPIVTASQSHSGSKSSYHNFRDGGSGRCALAFTENAPWEQIYLSYWAKPYYHDLTAYNGYPSRNFKWFRIEGDSGTKTGDQGVGVPIVAYEHREGSSGNTYPKGTFDIAWRAQYEPTLLARSADHLHGWGHDTWRRVECYVSVKSDSKMFRLWKDAQLTNNYDTAGESNYDWWGNNMGSDDSKFNEVFIGFYEDGGLIEMYTDDIYIDTTQARVELGNEPIFENCTHREIQIPTSWIDDGSSASIEFTFNQGTFSNEDVCYLFVVDDDGNASNGYQLTISESGDPIATALPSTPSATWTIYSETIGAEGGGFAVGTGNQQVSYQIFPTGFADTNFHPNFYSQYSSTNAIYDSQYTTYADAFLVAPADALSMSWTINTVQQDVSVSNTVNVGTHVMRWRMKPCLPTWSKKNSEIYANFCDVCGKKLKVGEGRYRWDGLLVCDKDWNPQHPQEEIRSIRFDSQEGGAAERPEGEDYFLGTNEVDPDDL